MDLCNIFYALLFLVSISLTALDAPEGYLTTSRDYRAPTRGNQQERRRVSMPLSLTSVYDSAIAGDFEKTEKALMQGGCPNEMNWKGETALFTLALGSDPNTVRIAELLLVYGADPEIRAIRGFYSGQNAIDRAKSANNQKMLDLFAQWGFPKQGKRKLP